MASPAKSVNTRDPSGLRRFEDASAKEMTALVDQAVERIADSLGPNPTAKEIEAAVNREAAQLTTASKALLVEKLTETYRRSSIRAEQLLRAGGMRVTGSLGPRGITPELRDRIELHALVNAESLSADLKARATRSLLTSVDKGEGMRPARKRLMEETGIDKVSAERIARTEIMNAYRDVNDEQFKRYGVQEEEWLAALDDRTCFPGSTTVLTADGQKRISEIRVGEMVMTRKGLRPVVDVMKRSYRGPMVEIHTDRGSVLCTKEHPLFVVGKGWMSASDVRAGHRIETSGDEAGEVQHVIHFGFTKTHNGPSIPIEEPTLALVPLHIAVPVISIHLDGNTMLYKGEVDGISADAELLMEWKSKGFQCQSEAVLQGVLPMEFTITGEAAISPIFFTRAASERLAASDTFDDRGRAPALLGTEPTIVIGLAGEDLAAALAGYISCVGGPAGAAAYSIAVCDDRANSELLSTDRAELRDILRGTGGVIAFPGTEDPIGICRRSATLLSAGGTSNEHSPERGIMVTLGAAIDCCFLMGAKFLFTSGAGLNHSHHLTKEDKIHHMMYGTINVYNLCVESEPEYYANGLLVHNCDECYALHGKRFPVGQRPHVHGGTDINCRCIMLPVIPEVGQAERS